MKFICFCFLLLSSGRCLSQSVGVAIKHVGVGVSAGHYGVDGAFGIDITSPLIIGDHVGFRIRGNLVWLEQYKATLDHWATYITAMGGALFRRRLATRADFLAEGGAMVIRPNKKFSGQNVELGYYALAGIEHYLSHKVSGVTYQISVGLISSGAHADKLENSPAYGTGFVFNTGFRFYF